MELLTRDAKKLDQRHPMARSSLEMEGRCRKHPEHRQSQGVCPFCLREKLSHLSASSSANSFATSSPSSRNSNLSSSPPCQALAKPEPLRKSRSLAFTIGRPGGDQEDKEKKKMKTMKKRKKEEEKKKKSKKGSFWSARWTLF